ncbi:hypothetical protein ACROYT_G013955 [Oculina patagonica]
MPSQGTAGKHDSTGKMARLRVSSCEMGYTPMKQQGVMESLGGKDAVIALIHVNYDISLILFFFNTLLCGMSMKQKTVNESPGSTPALACLFGFNPHTKRSLSTLIGQSMHKEVMHGGVQETLPRTSPHSNQKRLQKTVTVSCQHVPWQREDGRV